jgi:5-methylcytosine-specific restriction endonuclease McrA
MISKIAKKYNCLLVVDSTFYSPYLQNPLELGADIVVHSATKYIGGHSDILMGAIMCNDKDLIKKIRFFQSSIGAVPSPFECYLALRGLKTLHLRMDASQKNALKLAKFLESQDMVEKVIYPGLKSYDNYKLVKKQFRGFGSIISIYVRGDVNKFLKSLKIFKLAVSLGAVESLLCCPALMTHVGIPKEIRESVGITDNLVRISVGIENPNDLINDIRQALNLENNNFENYDKTQEQILYKWNKSYDEHINDINEFNDMLVMCNIRFTEYSNITEIISSLNNLDEEHKMKLIKFYKKITSEEKQDTSLKIKSKKMKKNEKSRLKNNSIKKINENRKEKIPISVKNTLWSLYFKDSMKGNCQCCKTELISKNNFDCGHIISERNGGKVELSNLKPICRSCNSSMSTTNMNDFMSKYGFDKI